MRFSFRKVEILNKPYLSIRLVQNGLNLTEKLQLIDWESKNRDVLLQQLQMQVGFCYFI